MVLGACAPRAGPMLDHQAILARLDWLDNRDWDWYESRVPFLESPDPEIDATYYYRWEVVSKHLTYGSPETGYTLSEFIDRPFWSGAYGAISCPLGHQAYEIRWLKDRRIIEDFARYWFETPGAEPRSYSNWYGDAMWATYLVQGDTVLLRRVLPYMERQYAGWVRERFDSAHGMFRWDGMHDGMETNINSRLTDRPFDGAEGYRPTLNSYLYADAMAISRSAALLGDLATSRDYAARAAALKRKVQQELWDPSRMFFFHQFAAAEKGGIRPFDLTYQSGPHAGDHHGREQIGYVPWQFNLPDPGYEEAWRALLDTAGFMTAYGPTTVERYDPQFYISPRCCVWSGNSWPYATTQTLVAMANLLNNYRQDVVSKDDWFRVFRTYTLTHRKDGRPFIAEAANPDNGSWDGHNSFYHSEHYFHSGYVDLVITGLAGLRPRADSLLEVNPLAPDEWPWFALEGVRYRGHQISIIWDRDGTRYRRGAGLSVFADGRRIGHTTRLERLLVVLPAAPVLPVVDRPVNFAVNNGRGAYPWVLASHTGSGTSPHYLIDGQYWYHESPPNRWTAAGSEKASDWIVLDFGIARPVETIMLYFLADSAGIAPPESYLVERWVGSRWVAFSGEQRDPARPEGHRANVVSVSGVETSRLRVTLNHRPGWSSGLSEIEAWGHAPLPLPEPTEPVRNLAFNPGGTGFPRVSASFTSRSDKVTEVNDMRFGFSAYSRNRWTAWGSPNPSDWVEVDFGGPRRIERLDLFLWGDDQGVKAPRRYAVQFWDGQRWAAGRLVRQLPEQPQTFMLNTVWIEPVETNRVRVVLEHDLPAASGMTELIVWEPEGSDASRPSSQATLSRGVFGVLPSGDTVEVYTLRNRGGMEVKAITYGGIITSIRVPDRSGAFDDVVLGYDSLAGYLRDSPYFGAIVGRYGNRIAKGRFTLDGITYRLSTNNGSNHLHGGVKGFDKVLWHGSPFEWSGGTGLALSYTSPDGEEGYPGTLEVRVTYRLSETNELLVDYEATTDKPTPVNLTQHSYFNLAGDGSGEVLHQLLQIKADSFLPVDSTLIPTGSLAAVAGTPFDFRSPTAIGARIAGDDPQLRNGKGYDHTFVLNARPGQAAALRVMDPGSGRTLEIVTTEPGLQFYSGNFLDGSSTGKAGHVYRRRYGFCLETQHYPDSPNHPRFPSTILRPGETYRSSTAFRFGITDRW